MHTAAKTKIRNAGKIQWSIDSSGRHWITYGQGHCKCYHDMADARRDYLECIEHALQSAGLGW